MMKLLIFTPVLMSAYLTIIPILGTRAADADIPVLCMHAPMELVSKFDCYQTMLACKAIYLA